MLLAKAASKRIASGMAQIVANACTGPQQETKGYQHKSKRCAKASKRVLTLGTTLPRSGSRVRIPSPAPKFSQSCRSICSSFDAAFSPADDVRLFRPNAGARPVAVEVRSPGRDHAA